MGNATRKSAVRIEQIGAADTVFPLFFAIVSPLLNVQNDPSRPAVDRPGRHCG
jgi:hypothetical protein